MFNQGISRAGVGMSAFSESGRSDHQNLNDIRGRLRPEGDVHKSLFRSLSFRRVCLLGRPSVLGVSNRSCFNAAV